MNHSEIIIPFAGIIGGCVVPCVVAVFIVWIHTNAKRRRYEVQAELYAKAIEHGQELPKDFFADSEKNKLKPTETYLHNGLILITVGIGIALFFWFASFGDDAKDVLKGVGIGCIPAMVGVAYIIIYIITRRREDRQAKQARDDGK
jgi:hypothetical protein